MRRPTVQEVLSASGLVILFCLFLKGWDSVVSFLGVVLTAIIPLVLGGAIAYVASIPMGYIERHLLPNSTSKAVEALRRPVALGITVVTVLVALVLSSSVLIPALIETVTMVQQNGQQFVEDIIKEPFMEPVRGMVQDFLAGDFVQDLKRMDLQGAIRTVFGGTVGSLTTQVFGVVSSVMTFFFGLLFSFILLTDTTDVGNKFMRVVAEYLGHDRTQRLALVMGVADASFHNFIVRQCIEAAILSSVGTAVLLAVRFPYALGVGVLMGLAALVPIVGYPVGLFAGAFMVAIYNVWFALLYVVCVAVTQMLEATFVLPHVGDPRTVLPPVWVTVAVTIGGGVAGFIGMLVANPLAATIRQLVLIDISHRMRSRER